MKYYFAPMEGPTGYIYRRLHKKHFHHIDKYFSPFIVANQKGIKNRELKDILPENNQGVVLIPQILAGHAADFIQTAKDIRDLGYQEINLNLGCPSGTVVSKGRGSGFLAKTAELDHFLEEIFTAAVTKISVKTRLGKEHPEEFYKLIEIFNKYPIEELIIHPRIQKDFYDNTPNLLIFKEGLNLSKNAVCYNGDLFTVKDCNVFSADFPEVHCLMLGRGLIANPGLIGELKSGVTLQKDVLKAFHDEIYEEYKGILFGDRNILFKMKELWNYMITIFSDYKKYGKKIRKAEKLRDYEEVVTRLFSEQEILVGAGFTKYK
ncbi:tRNA-dihydrouridine synthase [Anaerocolumna cellulosilytica]|uniref:tRNA-dihydrouridine synthase n=1 Tax=Anaerocolumna cellulosilytica TaxID=433286 RepID=A0A6S6R5C4_9FIRM|nr:tRNA-dihydrouridine synthase family protein [Anaerocolumna cellulosilytica]MBB5194779.1 tRNA-dihydrouridine synthase [Anaerocolumna cellulosilytica]BCJ94258.1 tRNA-dihydrouridine synthase [Anaerocolumna cellulosilytica]